jgi:Tfp pilus assembly protein PilX
MKYARSFRRGQRGVVLVVCLLFLVLLTLFVASAFTMQASSMKSVGNTQFQNEAISATNQAIEQLISSQFQANPVAQGYNLDVNNDGTTDYVVNFTVPVCLTASLTVSNNAPPSSLSLGTGFNMAASSYYRSTWRLDATVTDSSGSGATMVIHQAVKILLTQTQYNANCV